MKKIKFYRVFIATLVLLLLPFIGFSASAQEAEEYAPILYFEGEETCYPVSVDYFLANKVDGNISITLNDETNLIPYYDNILGTISDEGIISDYQSKLKANDPSVFPTVYYNINSSSGNTVIQYWMFYAFNPGEHNQHEGDWEMVEVVIPNAGSKWVAYSQHYSGQKATWDLVEKDGDNIKA